MTPADRVDPEIAWYYGKGYEATRLATRCQLEEARTRRIIARRLPGGAQDIVDIGGGAGAYAFWLAAQGHAVHLVDPVDLHVSQARTIARESKLRLEGLHRADAGDLPFPDEMFDVALSLGPLYHVTERDARLKTLREAYRVLRPGGAVFAAAINRYAMAVDGFFKGLIADPIFEETMKTSTRDGQHRNPMRRDGLFTTAYFHRPEELRGELTQAGFADVDLLAVEGPWPCIADFDRKWNDHRFRSLLMDVIEQMETDPTVIGFGGHVMAVGRRPQRRKRTPELRKKAARPTRKAARSTKAATRPATKATRPATKAARPATKATRPATKSARPATKATRPATKAARPAKGPARPSKRRRRKKAVH